MSDSEIQPTSQPIGQGQGHDQAPDLLFDLVSAKSFSGEEGPAAVVFDRYARALGLDSSIDEVGNAIAHRGATSDDALVHIVCLGHIDTVPGDIPVRIEDGVLHGRGSVDAKGPISAMLIAGSRAELPEGVRLTIAGAVGEEAAGSIGARHLAPLWKPDACLIGEPSASNGVTLGYKGRLLARATAVCPNTHSAGKDPSASDEIIAWWSGVLALVESFNQEPTRTFDQIQATISDMTSTCDGMEQRSVFNAGFRLPPAMDPETLIEQVTALCNEHVTIEFDGAERAHATTRNDPVVRALSSAIRTCSMRPHPKLKTGTADLNVVAPVWQCPIAAYGPGDSSLDHTPIEHLPLDEYQRSIDVLTHAISTLASELVAAKNATHAAS